MSKMANFADILEAIQILSQHGIHFTHKHKNIYYFEVDKLKQYEYLVSIQSLTKKKEDVFLHRQDDKVNWNPCSSWFMKIPAFCYKLEMYKAHVDIQ